MAYVDRYSNISRRLSDANRVLNRCYLAFDSKDGSELDVGALRQALRAALDALPAEAEASEDASARRISQNMDDPEGLGEVQPRPVQRLDKARVDHRRDFNSIAEGRDERSTKFERASDAAPFALDQMLGLQ